MRSERMDVTPFEIRVAEPVLDDLRARLAAVRWPDAIPGAGWSYGADLDVMRRVVAHWTGSFDWRAQERALNGFRHFRATVDGVGLHFVHEQGVGDDPLPIVLTHGWPGSFAEFLRLIPLLTDPARHGGDPADAFHVVVPSLPGYGFSDRPAAPGMHPARIAELWVSLMAGLGYARFGAQGGDWGASVGAWLARRRPERVIGLHLNYVPGSYQPHLADGSARLSAAEAAFVEEKRRWLDREGAYAHLQTTRPQTLAYALTDSPVGLAAWIIEKFHGWGDCGGDVIGRFTLDELLTQVMIYWVTGTIHSSCRLYFEAASAPLALAAGERIDVPCGLARFAVEAPFPPKEWVDRGFNVVRWTEMPRGGHFAAMEEPDLLAADIRAFFRPLRATR